MSIEGIVFDIARCCTNDGTGIRTTVFLKGCPLRCLWCHNPESQNSKPEILYAPSKCVNCGMCTKACTCGCHSMEKGHIFLRGSCAGCGNCAEACLADALRLVGRKMTAEKVMEEVIKDKVFYEESGGGLTVSGGEPLMQIDFLESLLMMAKKENIHTCIETCGYASKESVKRIAHLTDCFLFDWKETNSEKHRLFTGADNNVIYENLSFLNDMGAKIILRLPLIPGYNDTKEHLDGIADVINKNKSIVSAEFMPYHPLGLSKTEELGRRADENPPQIPGKALTDKFVNTLSSRVSIPVSVSA